MWRIQETMVSWLYQKLRGRWHDQKGSKVNKMNLCVIYSTNEYLQSDGSLFVVSFSNCIRYYFSNVQRLTYSGLFIFCFEQKISIGQRLKWFKIWNVVFETLALFGPGGDRILLGTDAVSFSNTHCIGDSHGYYFSFVASASQTRKVYRYVAESYPFPEKYHRSYKF